MPAYQLSRPLRALKWTDRELCVIYSQAGNDVGLYDRYISQRGIRGLPPWSWFRLDGFTSLFLAQVLGLDGRMRKVSTIASSIFLAFFYCGPSGSGKYGKHKRTI